MGHLLLQTCAWDLRLLGALGSLFGKRSRVYSPPLVNRTWDIWGSVYIIPKVIFYLLKEDQGPACTQLGIWVCNVLVKPDFSLGVRVFRLGNLRPEVHATSNYL